jgi:hypothetical protein
VARAEWLWDDSQDVKERFFVMLGQVIPQDCRYPEVAQDEQGPMPLQMTWTNRDNSTIIHQVVIRTSDECLNKIASKLESLSRQGKFPLPKVPVRISTAFNADSGPSLLFTFKGEKYELDQVDRPYSPPSNYSPSAASPEPAISDALDLTKKCVPLPGIAPFKTDAGSASSTIPICQLKGAIWFKADMDIDCDGGSTDTCKADRTYQPETSCQSSGKPLDASYLPYIVLPKDSNGLALNNLGLRCGSIAAVIYNGKIVYGVLGDRGPAGVIGEASYAMAQKLGIYADPNTGGAPYGVTYIVFTGNSGVSTSISDSTQTNSLGKTLLDEAIKMNDL